MRVRTVAERANPADELADPLDQVRIVWARVALYRVCGRVCAEIPALRVSSTSSRGARCREHARVCDRGVDVIAIVFSVQQREALVRAQQMFNRMLLCDGVARSRPSGRSRSSETSAVAPNEH